MVLPVEKPSSYGEAEKCCQGRLRYYVYSWAKEIGFLIDLDRTELNAMVIDVKGSEGELILIILMRQLIQNCMIKYLYYPRVVFQDNIMAKAIRTR